MKKLALLAFTLTGFLASAQTFALGGEVFKLEAVDGMAYCAGMPPIPLEPGNATFWLRVDSDTEFSVYLDAGLTQKAFTLPVRLEKLTSTTSKKGVVSDLYAMNSLLYVNEGPTPGGYLALNGTLKTKGGALLWTKTRFIRNGLTDTCSVSGVMNGTPVM